MSLICWLPGNVQPSDQELSELLPVFVSVTCAWNPPDQELTSEYTAEQAPVPGAVEAVGDGDGEGDGETEGDGEADGDEDGDAEEDGDGDEEVVPVKNVAGTANCDARCWLSIASTTYAYGVDAVSPVSVYDGEVTVATSPVDGASS